MNSEGINRHNLCKAAVAVTLVGISNQITPRAAAKSKSEQATRVPVLLDEKGRRKFHAWRALPEVSERETPSEVTESTGRR